MNCIKNGLIFCLSMVCALPAWAEIEGDFGYEVVDGTAVITNYTGTAAELIIPTNLAGYSVSAIGPGAFGGCEGLLAVTIPPGVTAIGSTAFAECRSLATVTFQEDSSLESIGNSAFMNTALREFTIPDSVTNVGYSVVTPYLEQLTIGDGVTDLCCMKFGTNLQNIVIGNGVTNITSAAFSGCARLTNVVFGMNVQSIDSGAFSSCTSLTEVTMPASLKILKNGPFGGCTSLTNIVLNDGLEHLDGGALAGVPIHEITVPSTVTNLGNNPFTGCTALERVDLSAATHIQAIPEYAFSGCTSLATVILPNGTSLLSIGNNAFENTAIREFVIPDSVTELGDGIVTPDLEQLVIGNGVTTLGGQQFGTNLRNVVIGDGVTEITQDVFDGCTQLTNIVLGANVRCIEDGAFAYLPLISIAIPPSVTNIGDGAFRECASLVAVDLSSATNLQSIGYRTFDGCLALASMTIPASVTNIDEDAFSGCSSLTALDFAPGATLQSIGDSAFEGCSSLVSVDFTACANLQSIGLFAFLECVSLASADFSACTNLQSIGEYAFAMSTNLMTVTIPASVTNMDASVFARCSALQNVEFEGAQPFLMDLTNGLILSADGSLVEQFLGGRESVVIPAGVEEIAPYAFGDTMGLTNVVLSDGLLSIGEYAFAACPDLVSVAIPSSVTNIGPSAFDACTALTTVLFQDGISLPSIGEFAFMCCYSLETITLPESVTEIGSNAFTYCTGLTGLMVSANVTNIAAGAFYGCTSLTKVTLQDGASLRLIGDYAFAECTSLAEMTIPPALEFIGVKAFDGCALSLVNFTGDGIPSVVVASGLLTSNVALGVSQNLQAFVDACPAGATLAVHEGTYGPIVVPTDRAINLVSVDGPEAAIIDGGGTNSCVEIDGYSAYRAADAAGDDETAYQIYVSFWENSIRATLTGFRLQNGANGVAFANLVGCHVTGCDVGEQGGFLSQCVLDRNKIPSMYGTIYFSTIVSNEALPIWANVSYSILWGNGTDMSQVGTLFNCWTEDMGDPLFVEVSYNK